MKHILLLLLLFTVTSFGQQKNGPRGFIENKGQIMDQNGKPNPTVQFLLNTNGLNVQIKKTGFSYDIYETKKIPVKQRITDKSTFSSIESNKKVPDYTLEYVFHRIDIDFVNANPNVQFVSEEKLTDYDNYYNISNKPEGVLMVHKFKKITYKNIYPNIDVVFSIPKDSLKAVEYNFVIHPNGKISDIQLKFNGAKTELLDNKIKMNVRFGQMEEILPASWTEDGMRKNSITVNYKKIKNNVYGFNTPNAVNGKTVIIDPVPTRLWGTYFGGNSGDFIRKIKTDKHGNVIIAGETSSSTNIATSGVFQSTKTSIWDASFFSKLNPDGKRVWGSYINSVKIYDLVINWNSEIYLGGSDYGNNSANNLTIGGAYKTTNPDFTLDGLILQFNTNGFQIWGTLYGGTGNDWINTLSLDSQENLVVAGETHSTQGIATSSAFQSSNNDSFDGCGFFAKFSIFKNRMYGSYFPGKINHSTVDNNDNLIFSGQYWILDADQPNISTPGAHQTQIHYMDGFIVKFNSIGQRSWCTYYGGDASFAISVNDYYDRITGIGTDQLNNIYVAGVTNSINYITTTGSYKENLINGGVNSFLSKFNSDGIQQWGTYYGDNNSFSRDICESSYTTKDGNTYITGTTRSTSNIATNNSYQPLTNGSDEGFISKFNTYGNLEWGTYYGGSNQDFIENIFYRDGNIYTIGHTTGSTNLGTIGTEYPTLSGGSLFIAKFQECLSSPEISSNSPICIGNKLELKASGGTNYSWTGPNGFSSTEQNPTIINATALNSGQYSCTITGTGGCDDTKKTDVVVGDLIAPIPNLTTLPTITGDCNTTINTTPTATDACTGIIIATTTSPLSYNLPGTYTIVWNYNDGNGNTSTQNQTVRITNQPLPVVNSPQTFCIQQNATINNIAITGLNIKWYDAQTNGNLLPNTNALQNDITYYASQTINGCESERTPVAVTIQNTPLPSANTNQSFCTGTNPTIANIQVTGNQIKWYDALNNSTLLAETTTLVNGITYYVSQTVNNCESERLGIHVSIVNTPPAPIATPTQSFCKNENATLEDIQISGQTIKWYDTNFSAASLPNTTLLEDNKTYYASQTIGCESDRTPILIRVYNTSLPTGNKNQPFCIDENATIANINILGSNIKWYDEAVNGNILTETTLLLDGKTYYATQTLNNCESDKLAITVKVQDTQNPIANSPQTFCIQENAKIKDIAISGQNISWYESVSSSTTLSGLTLLENGATYYASETINNCESGRIPVAIIIQEATTEDCINFVDELPYPKFFTPNNDGHNDTWTIDFAYLKPNTGIKIFDRYGKLLKVLLPGASWNGQFNNQQLPASDYWFIVTRANDQEYKGHFSLKR